MVIYEVEAKVDESLREPYETYMTSKHIPEVLATERFVGASFEICEHGRYRVCYRASDQNSLEKYLAENAEVLRADFMKHFPTGIELSRSVWTVLEHFA